MSKFIISFTNNHVIEVRVEGFALRNIHAERRWEVISCGDIVNIVETTRSELDLGEISWPNTSISIFSLILGEIWWVNVIWDDSISLIPFLEVVLLEMLMSRMNSEIAHHLCKLELLVSLVKKIIVFLVDHTMTVTTISRKHLESSTNWTGIESSKEWELRPIAVSLVSTNFSN